jgi:hypothetical protein
MLKIYSKRHIRFATVEQPTAWLVIAVLLETTGDKTIALSEPRVVKVIPKESMLALPAVFVSSSFKAPLALPAPHAIVKAIAEPTESPFASLFNTSNNQFIVWFSAQPPTK